MPPGRAAWFTYGSPCSEPVRGHLDERPDGLVGRAVDQRAGPPCKTTHRVVRAAIDLHVVADEEDRPAARLATSSILPRHFFWNADVADGQDLVDDQDLRLQVGRDREGQPDVHPAGVALHRRVEELLDLGEGDDLVELAGDLGLPHPEDRAVEVDVLAAGQLGVEAGADLQERGDPAPEPDASRRSAR